MREITERPEAVSTGAVRLIGTDSAEIVKEVHNLLGDSNMYSIMSKAQSPYGDGKAAKRIVARIMDFLS